MIGAMLHLSTWLASNGIDPEKVLVSIFADDAEQQAKMKEVLTREAEQHSPAIVAVPLYVGDTARICGMKVRLAVKPGTEADQKSHVRRK